MAAWKMTQHCLKCLLYEVLWQYGQQPSRVSRDLNTAQVVSSALEILAQSSLCPNLMCRLSAVGSTIHLAHRQQCCFSS